jgi:hypothetical protein
MIENEYNTLQIQKKKIVHAPHRQNSSASNQIHQPHHKPIPD